MNFQQGSRPVIHGLTCSFDDTRQHLAKDVAKVVEAFGKGKLGKTLAKAVGDSCSEKEQDVANAVGTLEQITNW